MGKVYVYTNGGKLRQIDEDEARMLCETVHSFWKNNKGKLPLLVDVEEEFGKKYLVISEETLYRVIMPNIDECWICDNFFNEASCLSRSTLKKYNWSFKKIFFFYEYDWLKNYGFLDHMYQLVGRPFKVQPTIIPENLIFY